MLTKLADAAIEPLTVAEVRDHLRADPSEPDTYMASLITVARIDAENRLQRTLIDTQWRVTLDSFPPEIQLPMPRILSVDEVRYVDTAGVEQVILPANYALDNIREPGWLVPTFGQDWPGTRDQINAVRVTYRAGYATGTDAQKRAAVPMPIKQWMLLCIGQLYELRERTVTGIIATELKFADSLLDTYRVIQL